MIEDKVSDGVLAKIAEANREAATKDVLAQSPTMAWAVASIAEELLGLKEPEASSQ